MVFSKLLMYGREPNVLIIFVLLQSKDFLASFTDAVSAAVFNATFVNHFRYDSILRGENITDDHLK